jgi:hypothetical protein
VEVATLPGARPSFHPKAWRFESDAYGVAFVGSSNLSRSALDTGIEWNLRVDRDRDGAAYARVCEAFDELWRRARRSILPRRSILTAVGKMPRTTAHLGRKERTHSGDAQRSDVSGVRGRAAGRPNGVRHGMPMAAHAGGDRGLRCAGELP